MTRGSVERHGSGAVNKDRHQSAAEYKSMTADDQLLFVTNRTSSRLNAITETADAETEHR